MATGTEFDAAAMAAWHAQQHIDIDPGVVAVYYLPRGAPERQIRLLEVNDLAVDLDPLAPLDFGVDPGGPEGHTLLVLDVTPAQWERIRAGQLPLPGGWSLDGAACFSPVSA